MEKEKKYTPKEIKEIVTNILEKDRQKKTAELNFAQEEMFKAQREFVLSLGPKQLVLYDEFLAKKRAYHSLLFHIY